MCFIGTTVDLEDSEFLCLIDSPIPKTAVLAGLAGLLNLLLQKAEGLADFGEILDFSCRTLKTSSRYYGN